MVAKKKPAELPKGRATLSAAERLHGVVAQGLLHNFRWYADNPSERVPPAFIAAVVQFLKLCGTTTPADDDALSGIASELERLNAGTRH